MQIIAGKYKNRPIIAPEGNLTRPTSGRLRESLFNICQGCMEDTSFLDLFAGSGAMGLEALSRGSKQAVFIETLWQCVRCIEKNIEIFGVEEQTRLLQGDVFQLLPKLVGYGYHFDIIYADPPYQAKVGDIPFSDRLLQMLDESDLLVDGGMLFIEDSKVYKPAVEELKTLELKRSRNFGRSALHEFVKSGG